MMITHGEYRVLARFSSSWLVHSARTKIDLCVSGARSWFNQGHVRPINLCDANYSCHFNFQTCSCPHGHKGGRRGLLN